MSFLRDMLGVIAERGRAIVDFSALSQSAPPVEQIVVLGERLLSSRGEATGLATASEILSRYETLGQDERLAFFQAMLGHFGPDTDPLLSAAQAFVTEPTRERAESLHRLSEPRRQRLLRLLNQTAAGTPHLIAMRADLLALLEEHPELEPVDRDFQHLFRSWFNRGFLELRRMDWSTPAAILERIIRYEAVHEIADWNDLRRRIDLPDRRLYAFFHPRLPDEPLIFLEAALTRTIASSIHSILDPDREIIDPMEAGTAVFYSISDCQPGLRGISFGNFLIKQVVEELRTELPHIGRFVTLSPVPTFAKWLDTQRETQELPPLLESLENGGWWRNDELRVALEAPVTSLAALFLTHVRNRKGRLFDPVARFHLGNGARLERINWLANTGPVGMAASHGIMVNYLYELDDIERNHERFVSGQPPAASGAVRRLANAGTRLLDMDGVERASEGEK